MTVDADLAVPAENAEIARWTAQVLRDGYAVIPGLIAPDAVAALDRDLAPAFAETPFCQGGFYGEQTKRFGRLLARADRAQEHVMHPLVLGIAEQVLAPYCDRIQLNLTQAIALHPGALPQLPHRDQDMWRGAIGETEYLLNVMWPLTPYKEANGATLVWPDSHSRAALDPEPTTDPIAIELAPGSALLFLGSTLHGAGGNRTDQVRRGMIISYCLGWLKPYENQWLAYPPDVARHFPPEVAALAGYRQHRPNLGNYEGQCPSILLNGDTPSGAIDALRPDQQILVEAYVERQRTGI